MLRYRQGSQPPRPRVDISSGGRVAALLRQSATDGRRETYSANARLGWPRAVSARLGQAVNFVGLGLAGSGGVDVGGRSDVSGVSESRVIKKFRTLWSYREALMYVWAIQ